MGDLTPDDIELLTSTAGRALLESLPPYAEQDALRLGERLRGEGNDARLVALALTQSRLRARATAKLGNASDDPGNKLLLTPDGLEQATRPAIAARHAARFVAAGVDVVFDLGCGLGIDSLAFARAGLTVRAVEADPATAALARHNLGDHERVQVRTGRAEDTPIAPADPTDRPGIGVWFDPARRTPGRTDASGRTRRVFALDRISPAWDFVQDTALRVPATGAKLSPAFPHARVPEGAEAEWVSFDGEVLECALWWGPLVQSAGRTATVLHPDGRAHRICQSDIPAGGDHLRSAPPRAGEHLYDPDRGVVRAGLLGALAARTGGAELSSGRGGAGYVIASDRVDVPWARRFVVVETMPATVKSIRGWARSAGAGRLTIKKRGSTIDPDRLRRDLRLGDRNVDARNGGEATIVLTSCGGRQIAIAVRPD